MPTAARVNTPNLPNANFTPIEFSVGAYRFGHALVRNNYHINDIFPTTTDIDDNVPIFNLSHFQSGDLSGGAPLPAPKRGHYNDVHLDLALQRVQPSRPPDPVEVLRAGARRQPE